MNNLTLFLVILLFFNTKSLVLMAQNRANGKDYAVFFANDDYQKVDGFGNLRNPVKDANGIANLLKGDFGFESTVHENLTSDQIKKHIRALRNKTFGENDQLLIFFSGHGDFDNFEEQGYFIPSGASSSRMNLMVLGSTIRLIDCPHILLIIDACYAGTIFPRIAFRGREFGRINDNSEAERMRLINNLLRYDSRLVITSGGKERVNDGEDNSPFTESILKTLRTGVTRGNGLVTYQDLLSGLSHVSPSPRYGTLTGHKEGGFVFTIKSAGPNKKELPARQTAFSGTTLSNAGSSNQDFQTPKMLPAENLATSIGSNLGEAHSSGASPEHPVNLKPFWLATTEVSFAEFDLFCEQTGRSLPDDQGWGRGNRPVINVSWYDAIAYCNWLSLRTGRQPVYSINGMQVTTDWTKDGFRLPTEAEWEAAAKAKNGNATFANGKSVADPEELNFNPSYYGRFKYAVGGVFRKRTMEVNSLWPNTAGYYHLSGNVAEWCYDGYSISYYKQSPRNNPRGPLKTAGNRVVRGGHWESSPDELRIWERRNRSATFRDSRTGFRLARSKNTF